MGQMKEITSDSDGMDVANPPIKVQLDTPFRPFMAGGIHDAEVRNFWEKDLKASSWVLELLRTGYVIPFKTIPPKYAEKNNKSARDNQKIVADIMEDMIAKGIVKVVSKVPHCVSPLGLVSKTQNDGTLKHRLIWDGSRHVNQHLDVPHVRLAHLERALDMTRQGDFQVVYDLTSAYYHIRIHAEQTQFLGAKFHDGNKEVWVEYQMLPFGLATAVHAITKVFKPVMGFLSSKGIRSSIFIDDGRILASSAPLAEEARKTVYEMLAAAGWALAKEKSDGPDSASQIKSYLGFQINTKEMKVFASPDKLSSVRKAIHDILAKKAIPAKMLASILGKIIALEPSHAMLARVSTRTGYECLAKHTEMMGWKGCIVPPPELQQELELFLTFMETSNGAFIRTGMTSFRLETILKNPIAIKYDIPNHLEASSVLVSDSSGVKAYVYGLNLPQEFTMEMSFSEDQKRLSSTGRELLALLFTLQHWKQTGYPLAASIYWATDSSAAASCIQKGSKSAEVQQIVFNIVKECMLTGLQVIPLHLRREDPRIALADAGSKVPDTDNWSIDYYSFQQLNEHFHFEFDLFASHDNTKLPRYCSLYYQPAAQALEAWSLDWSQLPMLWICPPVSQLAKVHHRIIESACEGVVCLPMWPTASFFTFFFDIAESPKHPFKLFKKWHPYIVQNEGATNTPLFGKTPFAFAALYFCTKKGS